MDRTLDIAGSRSAQWHCPRCTVAHSLSASNCGLCGFQRRARRSVRRPSHSSPHGLLGVLAKAALGGALGFAAGQTGLLGSCHTSSVTLLAAVAVFPAIRVIKGVLGLFRGFGGGGSSGSGRRPARSAGTGPGPYYHFQRQHGSGGTAGAEGAASGGVAGGLWGAAGGGGGEGRSDRVQLVMSMVRWLRVLEGPSGDGTVRGPLATLLMAELDSLVDELSYEELWEVFGGPPSERGLTHSQIQALPDFVVATAAPSSNCSSSDCGSNDSSSAVPHATRSRAAAAAAGVSGNRGGAAGKGCTLRQSPQMSSYTASECCAVCLEDLRPGERARLLPDCRHSFHAACIDPWLRSKPACPVCRAVVVATP